MPISEDEYDFQRMVHPSFSGHSTASSYHSMSKAEQRRSNKPIMEKRRRARINHCLNELKSLILDAMKKDPARHSKLEKADILEMTVKHLQTVQKTQLSVAMNTDPTVLHKFKTGFNECATEVSRYISGMDGVETGVKQRLVTHLSTCVNGLQEISPPFSSYNSAFATPGGSQSNQSEDVNNNNAAARLQMMTGLQLIPSRLPTGELALLVPNSQHITGLPGFFPPPNNPDVTNQVSTTSETSSKNLNATVTSGTIEQSRASAFTAVRQETTSRRTLTSPMPSPSSTYEDTSPKNNTSTESSFNTSSEVSSTSEQLSRPSNASPVLYKKTEEMKKGDLQVPLTVITNEDLRYQHPALDFSMKKNCDFIPISSSLLKRHHPCDDFNHDGHSSKLPRLTESKPSETSYSTVVENCPEDLSSRSSASSNAVQSNSGDMWRPW